MFIGLARRRPSAKSAIIASLSAMALSLSPLIVQSASAQQNDLTASAQSAKVDVFVNMARIIRLGSPASTIVVGNPAIASVTIQDPETLVLTGRAFGSTNMIILDAAGNPIADTTVQVKQRPNQTVSVYMADQRQSYACEPNCEPTIIAGDSTDFTANNIASSSIIGNAAKQQ